MKPVDKPTNRPSIWYRIAKLLPGAAAGLAVLALPEKVADGNYIGLGVSGLGIAGAALYYYCQHQQQPIEVALTLFWVWALLQLPCALLSTPAGDEPLWDASQFLSCPLYMIIKTDSGNVLRLGLNLFTFILFAWIRRLRIAENFGE